MGSWERKGPVSPGQLRCYLCLLQCISQCGIWATCVRITGEEFVTNSDFGGQTSDLLNQDLGGWEGGTGDLHFTNAPGFMNLKYLGLDCSKLTNLTVSVYLLLEAKEHLVIM